MKKRTVNRWLANADHADVAAPPESRRPSPDPGLEMIAAYQRTILAFAEERIAFAGSPPDDAQRMRDEASSLAATIGERLRADYAARKARQ
jgi:hypothetical protein